MIQVFIFKLIDNVLATCKTIFINKEKYLLGAIFNSLSTFFYLIAIVEITKSNSMLSIISMCVATFIGTILPGYIIKKSERDKLYIYDITADDIEKGKQFADDIKKLNIPIRTNSSYNNETIKVLTCMIYCSTKEESKLVNELIPSGFKYNISVPISNND